MQISSKYLLISFLLVFNLATAQKHKPIEFTEPLASEISMKMYPQDPEAAGVVIFKKGNYFVDVIDNYVRVVKEVHVKTKVFNAKEFKQATINIPYYRERNVRENITRFKAVTYNGKTETYVGNNAFFETDINNNWAYKTFTFPNVQDGSILEYTYRIESPYFTNFGEWDFQGPLPIIYSEFHAEIPGNFQYNRTLRGSIPLDVNDATIKKACFTLPGFAVPGDCESVTYAMKNVPAFKEEKYMLSKDNYLSNISYELVQFTNLSGERNNFTRNWDEIDTKFKYDNNLGRQLNYDSYFKSKLPSNLLAASTDLEKAKNIYYHIQQQMNWNEKDGISIDTDVKNAYEKGSGNNSEINFALLNALEAANLEAYVVLITTRDRAKPTQLYPVITDFNYAIVMLTLENEKYFLDATEKNTPFGVLPVRTLNGEGRVLDFKKGSYWEKIEPINRNVHYTNVQLTANEEGVFSGKVSEISTGYISVEKRDEYNNFTPQEILKKKQSKNESLDISNLEIENDKDLEQPYKETYDIELHDQTAGDRFFLFPFISENYFEQNPFTAEIRKYPIDFAFPISNTYLVSIDLNDQYELVKKPANKVMKLPENDGELTVAYDAAGNKITIRLNLKLNNHSFRPEAYKSLQEFFTQLIKLEKEEPLELKRI
ncbi:DUF3858 domain-containing protein [Aequorivita echinoideorum]|uniref:DUF3858 domain-containing protein n=1 Tax=Aequorivita echinoideorum TaxID=1549647 RepID=A0ABS5S764_9FLAO|nr:DUF3858 domain-containing protein [Aequorivita echinoideorum]MBT0608823.1 DUF3858 domain-containing protein [Aequorivita echinoideorum]